MLKRETATIFITPQEADQRKRMYFQLFARDSRLSQEQIQSAGNFFEQIQEALPPKGSFGILTAMTAFPEIQSGFLAAIQQNTVATYIQELHANNTFLSKVYVIQSADDSGKLSTAHDTTKENFSQESIAKVLNKLRTIYSEIQTTPMLTEYKNAYLSYIESLFRLLEKIVPNIGTPELTEEQMNPAEWGTFLDFDSSAKEQVATLPHTSEAIAVLEEIKNTHTAPTSFEQAFSALNITVAEKNILIFSPDQTTLTPEQGKKLFEIMLRRIGLETWSVSFTTKKSMSVATKTKTISIPNDRQMTPDEILYLIPHEMIHAIRSHNGEQQPFKLLSSNMPGNQETEEGVATLMEKVMGQQFGHYRQQIFAARYLAVAMALQVTRNVETNELEPKFTIQEIYSTLIHYGIEPETASNILWRITRGTSMKQKVVEIEVQNQSGQSIKIPVAECYVKDAVYFSGLIKLFDWIKAVVPLKENTKRSATTRAKYFSAAFLKRIGLAVHQQKPESISEIKAAYNELEGLGQEILISLVQFMLPGKLSFDHLTNPTSEWPNLITRNESDRIIHIRSLLKPSTER